MEKKRVFLVLLTCIACIPLCAGAAPLKESIWKGNDIYSGHTVIIDGREYLFGVVGPPLNRTSVKIGDTGAILNENECKDFENFSICAGLVNFAYENITLERAVYKSSLEFFKYYGKLELNVTFKKAEFIRTQTAPVNVNIRNIGSAPAEGIEFIQTLPANVLALDTYGCSFNENTIFWGGNLLPGERRECSYTL